jgi:hypothetical protein
MRCHTFDPAADQFEECMRIGKNLAIDTIDLTATHELRQGACMVCGHRWPASWRERMFPENARAIAFLREAIGHRSSEGPPGE